MKLTFNREYGDEFVTIYGGVEKTKFAVHKKLICDKSEFFSKAFNGNFREGQEQTMYLEEDAPGVVDLFCRWLYTSEVIEGSTQEHLENLFGLYIFAERLMLKELKNKTMDQIQNISDEFNQVIDHKTLARVWDTTKAD